MAKRKIKPIEQKLQLGVMTGRCRNGMAMEMGQVTAAGEASANSCLCRDLFFFFYYIFRILDLNGKKVVVKQLGNALIVAQGKVIVILSDRRFQGY